MKNEYPYIPRKVYSDILIYLDRRRLPHKVFNAVNITFKEIKLLEGAEMYSKDFKRSLQSLKDKADYLAQFSDTPITITLPKPEAQIKRNFTMLLNVALSKTEMPEITDNKFIINIESPEHEHIRELFNMVFSGRLVKDSGSTASFIVEPRGKQQSQESNLFHPTNTYTTK